MAICRIGPTTECDDNCTAFLQAKLVSGAAAVPDIKLFRQRAELCLETRAAKEEGR